MAAQHHHGRPSAPAGLDSSVVWRLPRSLGRQYARGRRDELQSEDRLSRLARKSAFGGALDEDRADNAGIRRYRRRPDRLEAGVDRKAGFYAAEQRGQQALL